MLSVESYLTAYGPYLSLGWGLSLFALKLILMPIRIVLLCGNNVTVGLILLLKLDIGNSTGAYKNAFPSLSPL